MNVYNYKEVILDLCEQFLFSVAVNFIILKEFLVLPV